MIFPKQIPNVSASTDMGNVSLEVPSIHPGIFIGQPTMVHTQDFQRLAGTPEAQQYVLIAAKSMALTGLELFTKPEVREEARQEFQRNKKVFTGSSDS